MNWAETKSAVNSTVGETDFVALDVLLKNVSNNFCSATKNEEKEEKNS